MKRLLTVFEAAEMLNTTDRTVYELIRTGRLRAAKIAGKWAIRVEWLEEYVEACVVAAS